jgi:hypothetical protein
MAGSGTQLAFCASTAEPVLIEVEARGMALVWLLAVWPAGAIPIGEIKE